MTHQLDGIDHVLIGVRDLEAARAQYARLGFNSTPRGRHVGWGTANYCIMFERDYLELLGIVDPAQFTNQLDRFLAVLHVCELNPRVLETGFEKSMDRFGIVDGEDLEH